MAALYFGGMAWMFLSNPKVLFFYGALGLMMTAIAYLMWRSRRRAAREASREGRVRLDLSGR